jgi:DNA/RNA-binding domain of Phe-tRNA-synthetase-like protein
VEARVNHPVTVSVEVPDLAVGVVVVEGCANRDSPEALRAEIERQTAMVTQSGESADDPRRGAVRDMLRHGRYKPTGRSKPASEYLVRAAGEGVFPRINFLADVNNLVSLASRFPISVIDLDRAGADAFVVRFGRAGESYVFNPSGQELDLHDLLLVAALPDDRPVATPVKDSQATKTDPETVRALGLIYGPAPLRDAVAEATARMDDLLRIHGQGEVASWMLP